MNVSESIEKFQELTGFKLNEFLLRVDFFFRRQQQDIVSWYEGVSSKPNSESFKCMNILLSESDKVLNLFKANQNVLNNFSYWELLDNLENIKIKLKTTSNLSKILRSTRTKNDFSTTLTSQYTMSKHETLENVSRKVLGSDSYNNEWWQIAINNDLSEENYDSEGGTDLQLSTKYNPGEFLESVVDNPIGEKMYGRDFNRKLTFTDNDLESLSYQETILQSLDIFMELKKGTVPENMDIGFDETLIVGTNRGVYQFSKFQQQFLDIFNTDDSFRSLRIKKLEFIEDSSNIEFEVNTILGETKDKTIQI